MKLGTFRPQSAPDVATPDWRLGLLAADGKTLVDLAAAQRLWKGEPLAALESMQAWLDEFDQSRDIAQAIGTWYEAQQPAEVAYALTAVELAAPLPRPQSIRDAMVFEQHVRQSARAFVKQVSPLAAWLDGAVSSLTGKSLWGPPAVWYQQPIYYKGNPGSVVGPGAEIRFPQGSKLWDYELEFGIYIGRRGRDIPAGQAMHFVAGYTIFNDFTARDLQLAEVRGHLGPTKSKDFDTGNAMGPWLVTTDEAPGWAELGMAAYVNGELWSQGSTAQMHFTFPELIEHISRDETLFPGDFIASGTVGNGCGLELGRYLKPGDVVRLEVEQLGVLENRISGAS